MILLVIITRDELISYRKSIISCLNKNSNNSSFTNLIILTNEIDNSFLNLNSKISVIYKKNITQEDVKNEFMRFKNINKLIKSDPFVVFGTDLYKITQEDVDKNTLVGNGFKAFSMKSIEWGIENPEIKCKIETKRIQNLEKESIKEVTIQSQIIRKPATLKTKIEISERDKKLDVIIVSVNYNDYLVVSLSHNVNIFNNITVVTSTDDIMCQKICEKFKVNCVVTDVMYENGSKFNKGKAINKGVDSINEPDFILILDADIIVKNEIDLNKLSDSVLYTSDRWIFEEYKSYLNYLDSMDLESNATFENNKGLGFFQLFNVNNKILDKSVIYPETFDDASWSDLIFRDKFTIRQNIDIPVFHLGSAYQNWKGRVTSRFLTDDEFMKIIEENLKNEFDINEYFDKIYCLNLDRREDRWNKVKQQFNRFDIKVKRWSAIDGSELDDELLHLYNPDNLKGEQASRKGIVENKNSIACLFSHLEIIKDAKLNNYKKILIFEDDVLLSNSFDEEIKKIRKFDWKIFYLGASQFDWSGIEIKNGYYNCNNTLGTFAYAIDSTIYDLVLNSSEMKSIDNLLISIQKTISDSSFTIFPNIVISDVNDSDIRESKNMYEYSKLMKWENEKFIFIKESNSIIKKEEALKNLIDLDVLFRELNVEYWLTCGTLLGFYRENDFIGHDKDTDICLNSKHFNGYVLKRIVSLGFKIINYFGEIKDGFEISFMRNGVKNDIFLFYKNEYKWYNSVYADFTEKDCLKFDYIYEPFEISENVFLGYSFKTPKNIESFLTQQYGEDFRKPNTNWIWWKSPKNLLETNKRISKYDSEESLNSILEFNKNIYLNNLTILIKSFLRKDCVDKLIYSIRQYYPKIKILIIDDSGDDNYNFNYDENIQTHFIDFDSGLSKGRNEGVSLIETEYFLLLDDDFEFTKNTNLIEWMEIMIESNLDLLGADVIMNGEKMDYFGNFELVDKCLYYKNIRYEVNNKYKTCDFVLNFFIAKTSKIKKYKWDDELKLAEHTAFFFEHKGKLKVGHTDLISINHQKVNEGNYANYRKRGQNFFYMWMKKKNIEKTINLKGEITLRK